MPFTSKDLKSHAKKAMQGLAPSAVLITLVYLLLTTVLTTVVNFILPSATVDDLVHDRGFLPILVLFLSILLSIYRTVMGFGYNCWALETARGQQTGFWTLLDGFGMVAQVIWMNIRIFCAIMVRTVMLSMVCSFLVILVANISVSLGLLLWLPMMFSLLSYVLLYEMAPFLLHDHPEQRVGMVVHLSKTMMYGQTWKLIKLYLSFWPWYLARFLLDLGINLIALFPILGAVITAITTGNPFSVYTQVQLALGSALVTVLSLIAQLIIEPRFFPYRRIAVANFYRALSGELTEHSFSGESF